MQKVKQSVHFFSTNLIQKQNIQHTISHHANVHTIKSAHFYYQIIITIPNFSPSPWPWRTLFPDTRKRPTIRQNKLARWESIRRRHYTFGRISTRTRKYTYVSACSVELHTWTSTGINRARVRTCSIKP